MSFGLGISQALDPLRLRLLLEVRNRGSISAAAESCRLSQPSATKHLKTLEAAVGESLVERAGRRSRLTEAGEVVAEHAAGVLDSLGAMEQELHALRGAERGSLTIAASTTPGTYVLPSILRCFAEDHPNIDVEVAIGPSAWVAERVARREAQIGLAGELDSLPGVRVARFLEDEVVGVAAPRLFRDTGNSVSVEALAGQTLLVREPGSSTRAISERYLRRLGVEPSKRWELDSNEAIKRAVQAGLGVGFLSRLVVADELQRGELSDFRLAGAAPMARSILLLQPETRELTPPERAFVATLGDCCEALIPGCVVGPGLRQPTADRNRPGARPHSRRSLHARGSALR